MKRLLVFGSYLLLFTFAWAQVNLSMDLGYGNKGYSYSEKGIDAYNGSLPKGQSCYFAPRIGYVLNDEVSMGIRLGVSYSSYDFADGLYDSERLGWQQLSATTQTMLTAKAGAYLRIRCLDAGRLSLHAEIMGSYVMGWGWDQKTEYRATDGWDLKMTSRLAQRSVGVQVVPVANYALGEHVGMDVYLNLAAITFSSTTTSQWPYSIKEYPPVEEPESTTVSQVFDVGVNTLNTSLLTLGFSYTF